MPGASLSPWAGGGTFQYRAPGLCCLLDRLGVAVVAVAVVCMEGLPATVLSEAGSALRLFDRVCAR